jgi:hypothetical protein
MKNAGGVFLFVLFTALLLKAQRPAQQTQNPAWIDCILITKTGDAVTAKLKNKKDFSALGCLLPGQEIIIRRTDGKEVITAISNINEMLIPGRTANNNHYLVLNCNHSCPGQFHIYRVITEVPCKLLYTQMPGNAGNMTINISHHGQTISTLNQKESDEYYLYYNKGLMQVQVDEALNLKPVSGKDCIAFFKSCAEVAKKLGEKNARPLSVTELVAEFNRCGKAREN